MFSTAVDKFSGEVHEESDHTCFKREAAGGHEKIAHRAWQRACNRCWNEGSKQGASGYPEVQKELVKDVECRELKLVYLK